MFSQSFGSLCNLYMHLSSYSRNGQVYVRCHGGKPNSVCANSITDDEVFCPTCAKEGEWVATDRNDPIGYSGNFLITSNTPDGWAG